MTMINENNGAQREETDCALCRWCSSLGLISLDALESSKIKLETNNSSLTNKTRRMSRVHAVLDVYEPAKYGAVSLRRLIPDVAVVVVAGGNDDDDDEGEEESEGGLRD
ncbi:hypothetical protein EAI_00967 [Harpegnathos saltator]|uniref:Uncharacterized protein n=1 Tax=Harpegnathos saltator TaxID=610380 RepID=E2C699_HARSA|nr:hypothetical protein EAI_00967 [Harpegnathos saltator]